MRAVDNQGNEFALRPIDCPTCRVRDLRVLGVRGGALAHRYGFGVQTDIVKCRRCGLLFPDPFPFPCDHNRLYGDPDKYFESHDERAKIESYRGLVSQLRARTGTLNPRVLDVGSGRGELLRALADEGCNDFVGLEFADAMVEYVRTVHGIEVRRETIESFSASKPLPFDAITLNAVLEHVYDPAEMIGCCAGLLRRGGVLYIDVPNEPHLMARLAELLGRLRSPGATPIVYHLAPTWSPYHVFGFNPQALRALLGKHGFAVQSITIKAGVHVPHNGTTRDRCRSLVGEAVQRLANVSRTASNMTVWAVRS